jgi:hypothetical protein
LALATIQVCCHALGCGRFAFDPVADGTTADSSTPRDVTDGLVAWWKLDEPSGSTAYDSVGGAHGVLMNGVVRVAGRLDGAAAFDGVSAWIDLGPARIALPGPITVCTWVNPAQISPTTEHVIVRACDPASCQYSFELEGDHIVSLYWADDGSFRAQSSENAIALGIWQLVCAIRTSDTEATIYVDSAALPTGVVGGSPSATPTAIGIGANRGTASFFSGMLDDIRIYDRALAAPEIMQLYAYSIGK